jgi:hypothetical protein
MVYDSAADKMILFGGTVRADPTWYLNETWAYHYQLNPPSVPLNLNTAIVDGDVNLTWNPPSTDAGSVVTNYLIYRGTESGSLSLVDTLDIPVSSFTDDTVEKGETYYYAISAKNAIGEGSLSEEVTIKLPKPTPGFIVVLTASVLGLLVFFRKKKT